MIKNEWEKISDLLIDTRTASENFTFDATGYWSMSENYDHGRTTGTLYLQQVNKSVKGCIVINDLHDQSVRFKIREPLEGEVIGNRLLLEGLDFELLEGQTDQEYQLDTWSGTIKSSDLISGTTEDEGDVAGVFNFTRMTEKPGRDIRKLLNKLDPDD